MKLIGSFFQFARRVLKAARAGKLPKVDLKKLEHLLTRTGKRNLVLAKGLLSALNAGGAKKEDIKQLAKLLEKATTRIAQEKEPFTTKEKKELENIFARAYLSKKAAHWFTSQVDEFLAEEIDEFITGKRMLTVPTKKVIGFEKSKKKKRKMARA